MAGEYPPEVVADLHAMVAHGLSNWDLSGAAIRLLNLSENATFALRDSTSGREWVLRLHRIGYCSAGEIRSELAWIGALRDARIVETAMPVAGRNGDLVQTLLSPSGGPSRHAVAFDLLPGREPDAGTDALRWFERLGELTAKMHRHSRSWNRPAGFSRKRWGMDEMVGPHGHWGSWRDAIGLDLAGIEVIEQALTAIAKRLDRYGSGPERFGLIHADLRLANLLVDGEHLRVIDFDDCGFSWFLYDFATSVSFMEHEPVVPDLLDAWLRGYRRIAPLSAEDHAEIATFVVLRRVLLCAWLASHAEIPFARRFGAAHTQGAVTMADEFLRGRFLA